MKWRGKTLLRSLKEEEESRFNFGRQGGREYLGTPFRKNNYGSHTLKALKRKDEPPLSLVKELGH